MRGPLTIERTRKTVKLSGSPACEASGMTLPTVKVVSVRLFAVRVAGEVVVNVTPLTVVKPFMSFIGLPLALMELVATWVSLIHKFRADLNLWPIINLELSDPPVKASSNHKVSIVMLIVVNCVFHCAG